MSRPLHVGFNAYLLASPDLRGWTRYTVNLLAALPAHGVRPVLYSNAPVHPDHLARLPPDSFEVRVGPPMRYLLWENRWVPRQLAADRIDAFHCPKLRLAGVARVLTPTTRSTRCTTGRAHRGGGGGSPTRSARGSPTGPRGTGPTTSSP